MIPPYPLQWPSDMARSRGRVTSQFRTSLTGAIKNVEGSISKFGSDSGRKVDQVQVTSNAALLSAKPDDPGVSVWFKWDGQTRCIAVDKYTKVECNLQAIHHVIEARRTELRHAGIEMVRTSFRGFVSLPPPGAYSDDGSASWWVALGLKYDATHEQIKAAYKNKSRAAETESAQKLLNLAKDEGLRMATGP